MKVLVISATFPPMKSGGADFAYRLCQHLAAKGLDVHIATSQIKNIASDPKLKIYPIMKRWSWLELSRLILLFLRLRPDVVNIHFTGQIYHNHPMVTFLPALFKQLNSAVRIVTHLEHFGGIYLERVSSLTRVGFQLAARVAKGNDVDWEYGTLLRDSDCIIVLSATHSAVLANYRQGITNKCLLIPPPPILRMTDATDATRKKGRELLHVSADEFLVAYYGYLYPQKGIETLFEAFHLASIYNKTLRMVMLGGSNDVMLREVSRPNYVAELQALAGQLGIAERIIWTGYYPTDSEQPSLCLRGADACILAFDNGVHLNNSSFAAAAAHGLPIITTRGEIVEPPIRDRQNVLLCSPKQPQELASALEELISSHELRQQLRAGALGLTNEWFSWEQAISRTVNAFAATKSQ